MRTFEESLKRVLNPEHYLWGMVGSAADDAAREREVEIRLDIPAVNVETAAEQMAATGWTMSSRPDDGTDPLERIYWRKVTAVETGEVTRLLSEALRVAHDCEGTLMSWINVEDLEI